MAIPDRGPADDPRANYDYRGGDVDRPALVDDLEGLVAGEVRFDDYSKQLYATDASLYERTPIGVVLPRSTADVAAVMNYCARREIPVLPRGGGTSLAGQAVNEAVVIDFTRHMDDVLEVDPAARTVRAQPGVTLGELNGAAAPHGLTFGPDPAWGDKSALGGAIGNNSTGAHSLIYGKTDAYIESCEVVLADGTVTTFGEVPLDELHERADPDGDLEARLHAGVARIVGEERAVVEAQYPDLKRNVSGYNLDVLVEEAADGAVNLARLLAGSEGTLAIVTEATVSLEPTPDSKAVALLTYDALGDAMADVSPVLEHDPAAVEVLDDVLLDLARDTEAFGDTAARLPRGTGAVLLVEFFADSAAAGRDRVADLVADLVGVVDTAAAPREGAGVATEAPRRAVDALEAHDAADREAFWNLRKSGLPILLSRTTDEKHVSFVEDTAVPAEALPDYVADVRAVLDEHDTYASFYAHAGPGVLHIRPLVDTKSVEGVETMRSIADAVTDLVVEYGGSVAGEHGDGRARTEWSQKQYGGHLRGVFRDLKTAFDPDWLLNPGVVCGDVSMDENLRFGPDYDFDAGVEPRLEWNDANGFQGMVELCHGCGGCRGHQATTGGVMCPTFRAADEEITSTRGRANLLRQAMSGDLPPGEHLDVEFMHEVLELCIGCKGCARDCPSGVDLAKLKAELAHAHHVRHGAGLRDRLFANVHALSRIGSALAPVSNWVASAPGAGWLAEHTLGIARERSVPTFRRESLTDWFAARCGPAVSEREATRRALLVPDAYTTYIDTAAGRATVRVLEAADVHVRLPEDVGPTGRPAFSKGFLDTARERASRTVDALAPRVADGWDVVVVEPSDAVMLQSDYPDLLDSAPVERLAGATNGVAEYLVTTGLLDGLAFDAPDERLVYHGHCHQYATKKAAYAAEALRAAGYAVEVLDSGCCGMAGSFGYEAEHYSMSQAIGRVLFEQVDAVEGEVVAPGASCRTQLGDHYGEPPAHPVEKLAAALV